MARNPRTGTPVALDKRYVPVFKASPDFQEHVDVVLKEKDQTGSVSPSNKKASGTRSKKG
jgi:hypothetical protein